MAQQKYIYLVRGLQGTIQSVSSTKIGALDWARKHVTEMHRRHYDIMRAPDGGSMKDGKVLGSVLAMMQEHK